VNGKTYEPTIEEKRIMNIGQAIVTIRKARKMTQKDYLLREDF